jgi:hypothetical protein
VVAIAAIWFVGIANAAEITALSGIVVLEGQIEPGDYDKLRDFLVVKRQYGMFPSPWCFPEYLDGCPEEIYLASPGGDVAEAMKIGRLVRALGWTTIAPTRFDNSAVGVEAKGREINLFHLKDPKTNYMCASACFLVFVGGISKEDLGVGWPLIGIHRPYLSAEQLKELTGSQAIATANLSRAVIEKYLKEMDVPTKYIDQMFSVPKDQILWLTEDNWHTDFSGFIPSLRDWVDAKCYADVEKALEAFQQKWDFKTRLTNWDCEKQAKFELRKDAWPRWRKEALQNIAETCAARKNSRP